MVPLAASGSLSGLRVLVVEDEMLVSLLIEDVLNELLCIVVGPYSTLGSALAAAQRAEIDFALLDVNIGGAKVYPVAEALQARRIPFLFLSGYGDEAVPADRPEWRVCSKPFQLNVLVETMLQQLDRSECLRRTALEFPGA
jgi:CheY-like chemotaxis protein